MLLRDNGHPPARHNLERKRKPRDAAAQDDKVELFHVLLVTRQCRADSIDERNKIEELLPPFPWSGRARSTAAIFNANDLPSVFYPGKANDSFMKTIRA